MEELRSTEALDNEIRSDCRKKAERVLAKGNETAKALLDEVDSKIQQAEANATKAMEDRVALYEKNINASLPLEKQRYLVSYINDSIIDGINSYFDKISDAERLDLISHLVEKSKTVLGDAKVNALYIGFDEKSVNEMLKKHLSSSLLRVEKGKESLFADEAVKGLKRREGVILKTEDGKISCRLTLDEKVKELLDDKNYELSKALFGGRLPE